MMGRLFVAGLAWRTDEESLARLFAELGDVEAVKVVMDRETGRSKGYGFVEMADPTMLSAAIERLDGRELDGRTITVMEARPRSSGAGPDRDGPASRPVDSLRFDHRR